MMKCCTYLRVSTQRQGAQGLGISAQRAMCENFIKQNKGEHVQEFMDVESGTHRDRKGLWQAIDYCKKNDCSLVIAKLDRMSRDVEFTFKVINTGIDIHFTDMPVVNSMILGVFAAVAQYEREMVSTRTRQALAVKKSQGCKLGAANEKYRENFEKKDIKQRIIENMKRGETKRARYMGSRDTTAFIKVLQRVFPNACTSDGNIDFNQINTQRDNRIAMLSLMRDYKSLDNDGVLFVKWDLDGDLESKELHHKLANFITSVKRSMNNENVNVG